MEAALARAEAAERELEELRARSDADQAQIEALRQEVARLKRSGRREAAKQQPPPSPVPAAPTAPEEKAWRRARAVGAVYVGLALVYLAFMVWLVVGSAVPEAPWGWLRSEGLSQGPLGAYAGWGLGLGILAYFACLAVVMSFNDYIEKKPDLGVPGPPLLILFLVVGPLWVFAAVVYAVKLFRRGSRARWLAAVLLVAALSITVLAGTFWLFTVGDPV